MILVKSPKCTTATTSWIVISSDHVSFVILCDHVSYLVFIKFNGEFLDSRLEHHGQRGYPDENLNFIIFVHTLHSDFSDLFVNGNVCNFENASR